MAGVDASLRMQESGLVTYNRILNHLGPVPVSVCYFRADFDRGPGYQQPGQHQLWEHLEPRLGVYNFSVFTDALDHAERAGLKMGFRVVTALHPRTRLGWPNWIRIKPIRNSRGELGRLPDWEHPSVRKSIQSLLKNMGDALGGHPALLFVDVGAVGVSGGFHTNWGGWENDDFMPSLQVQKLYLDYHIEAFGADRLLLNLNMDNEILRYGVEQGIQGWRSDAFGSRSNLERVYPGKFKAVPELLEGTGPRFFEITGGNMAGWKHDPEVSWSIDRILNQALQYRCTLFANKGWEIPEPYLEAYLHFQRAMKTYIVGPSEPEETNLTLDANPDEDINPETEVIPGTDAMPEEDVIPEAEATPETRFSENYALPLEATNHDQTTSSEETEVDTNLNVATLPSLDALVEVLLSPDEDTQNKADDAAAENQTESTDWDYSEPETIPMPYELILENATISRVGDHGFDHPAVGQRQFTFGRKWLRIYFQADQTPTQQFDHWEGDVRLIDGHLGTSVHTKETSIALQTASAFFKAAYDGPTPPSDLTVAPSQIETLINDIHHARHWLERFIEEAEKVLDEDANEHRSSGP